MYCGNCGARLDGEAQFCVECGEPVINLAEEDRKKVDLSKPGDHADSESEGLFFQPGGTSVLSEPVQDIYSYEQTLLRRPRPDPAEMMPEQPNQAVVHPPVNTAPPVKQPNQTVAHPPVNTAPPVTQPNQTVVHPPVNTALPVTQPKMNPMDINARRNMIIAGFNMKHHNPQDYFGKVEGKEMSFPLFDKRLDISAEKDAFNTYRLKFRNLAIKYTNKFFREYNLMVVNLETFVQYFPQLYLSNMEYLVNTAMDVLAAEDIWTQTYESFYKQHSVDFHAAMDIYKTTLQSINLTVQNNRTARQRSMSYLPGVAIGFRGVGGFIASAAMATGLNMARDAIVQNVANAASINVPQKMELYRRIVPATLFHQVYMDYWQIFLSVVFNLRQNGKNIWWGTKEMSARAGNMFKNLSNPRFPKEKSQDLIMQMLELFPYNKPVYYYMLKEYGDTPEISAVRKYFGYFDLSNPRII